MKRNKWIGTLICITFIFIVISGCATTSGSKNLLVVKTGTLHYEGGKIAIMDIEGWQDAVNIMKNSFINSLFDLYTTNPEEASYRIAGGIYAKRYWKSGRLYFYYTVSLRLIDKADNIVMTFKNTKPFYQPQLGDFTDEIVKSIRGIEIAK